MVTFEQLHDNIHQITQSSNVLVYLIMDRAICDTDTTNSVFFDFMKKTREHLDMEDKEIYRDLLSKGDNDTRNTANRFMSGSQELKRLLDKHMKHWANAKRDQLNIDHHIPFVRETEELTGLMLDRLQDETENLYPLIRKITEKHQHMA